MGNQNGLTIERSHSSVTKVTLKDYVEALNLILSTQDGTRRSTGCTGIILFIQKNKWILLTNSIVLPFPTQHAQDHHIKQGIEPCSTSMTFYSHKALPWIHWPLGWTPSAPMVPPLPHVETSSSFLKCFMLLCFDTTGCFYVTFSSLGYLHGWSLQEIIYLLSTVKLYLILHPVVAMLTIHLFLIRRSECDFVCMCHALQIFINIHASTWLDPRGKWLLIEHYQPSV